MGCCRFTVGVATLFVLLTSTVADSAETGKPSGPSSGPKPRLHAGFPELRPPSLRSEDRVTTSVKLPSVAYLIEPTRSFGQPDDQPLEKPLRPRRIVSLYPAFASAADKAAKSRNTAAAIPDRSPNNTNTRADRTPWTPGSTGRFEVDLRNKETVAPAETIDGGNLDENPERTDEDLLIEDDQVLPGYEYLVPRTKKPVQDAPERKPLPPTENRSPIREQPHRLQPDRPESDGTLETQRLTPQKATGTAPDGTSSLRTDEQDAFNPSHTADRDQADKAEEPKADQRSLDPHLELLAKNKYPSARECGECHEQHYREWSVSSHAYAAISPMFQKFEQKINDLSKGTIGYFCMRCHSPVGVAICESRDESLWNSIPAANEGVTCIACHRVVERYYKVNGERRIETGSIFEPVVASSKNNHLKEIIERKDKYKVKTSPEDKGPGQPIHNDVVCFQQLSSSHFCVSCHQVAVYPGIKLEIVWDQYRASPACKEGVSCQDCHMGAVPGKAEGYAAGPTAIVAGQKISPQNKHSNHMFYGPGYSIAHPGTFPINKKADRWSIHDWLEFDWRAGWGTEDFEDAVAEGRLHVQFPPAWKEADDRMDAREIVDENLELLGEKRQARKTLMEGTSKVEGPFFVSPPSTGRPLRFRYRVTNLNRGHNMPSGSLGAQPQLWLNVVLTGPRGQRLWESGYVDANGDVADVHSLEVAAGRISRDRQLFNLQTKFLTTHVKGTDREMYLPINVDIDQLPFLRPSGLPITNLNHPPFIRLENHSLPPLGERMANYVVPSSCIREPGRYRLSVRMRSRAEPIYFMRFCQATPEMERSMNERMLDFHQQAYEFVVR